MGILWIRLFKKLLKKKSKIRPRLGSGNIKLIERAIEHQFPEDFKEFMVNNAGLSHYECIYIDDQNRQWEVSQYNHYKDLIGLAREFKKNGWGIKVSFAYDPRAPWVMIINISIDVDQAMVDGIFVLVLNKKLMVKSW